MRSFQQLFLWIYFSPTLLLSRRDTNAMNNRSFVIVPDIPEALFIYFFHSFLPLLFIPDNCYCSVFKFTNFFPLTFLFCYWAFLSRFLCWLLYYFSPKTSMWFFFITPISLLSISVSLLRLSIFSLIQLCS